MHAMSNVGKAVKKATLTLEFMSGFKGMSNTSTASKDLFKEICGIDRPTLADKSFWRWYQCMEVLLTVFQHVSVCEGSREKNVLEKEYRKDEEGAGKERAIC
jgi:hypothetical protein